MTQNEFNGQESSTHPKRVMIDARHVVFRYSKDENVLEDVSFQILDRQSVAVLGRNGAGKSTLFKVIVGLLRPQAGEVALNGELLRNGERDVFLLAARNGLIPNMTVRENLIFRKLPHHNTMNERDWWGFVDEQPVTHLFELAQVWDTRAGELSAGWQKKVGLAAGLLFDPRVLLLDEPTNSIDSPTRDALIRMIRSLRDEGRTVVTVTHDLDFAWNTADRVLVLDEGRVWRDVRVDRYHDYEAFRCGLQDRVGE